MLAGFSALLLLVGLGRAFYFKRTPEKSPVFYAGTEAPCVQPPGWLKEYRFRPDCKGIGRAGAASAEMRFNSAGFRGPDYSPQPARDVYRVLVLGASNVLGIGVEEEMTLPRRLEVKLSKRLGRKVEVINGAVNGYCTWQTAFLAREQLRRYRPHLVLHNLGVPSCMIYDWIWEGRIVRQNGEPVGIDRSLFPPDGALASLNKWYYHPSVFYPAHTAHEMARRVAAAWRLKLAPEEKRPELISASMRRASAFIDRAAREEGAFYVAFFHPAREPVVNHFLPYVLKVGIARLIAAFQPEVFVSHRELWRTMIDSGVPTVFLRNFVYDANPDDGHLTKPSLGTWAEELAITLKGAFSFEKAAPKFRQELIERPCPGSPTRSYRPDQVFQPGRPC